MTQQTSGPGSDVRYPLRVLLVSPRFIPDVGGVERHVYEVSERLAAEGVEVSVLTTDRTRRRLVHDRMDGIRIRRVPAWPAERDYYVAPGIYTAIIEGCFDIIHVQSWDTFVAPTAMLAALRREIPYVITPHGGGHSSHVRNALRPLQRSLLRPLLRRAACVVATARFEREMLVHELHLPPDQVTLIPNGSDLPRPPRPGPTAQKHRRAGAMPNERVVRIASVGRLERYKGHHRVLSALPHVLAEEPNIELWIAGTGPYEEALRELAERLGVADQVTIQSNSLLDRDAMAAQLAECALVVLLSEYETHPMAALEAAALSRPLLVADTSGLHELVVDGIARPVPVKADPQRIARAILDQLARPLVPGAIDLPTWDDCAHALLRLYRSIHMRRNGR